MRPVTAMRQWDRVPRATEFLTESFRQIDVPTSSFLFIPSCVQRIFRCCTQLLVLNQGETAVYLQAVSMLTIFIRGLENGTHPVDLSMPAKDIPYMFPEFYGDVTVKGEMQKLGNKYFIVASAECPARLLCDISGEEYTENVEVPLRLHYIANTDMYLLRKEDADGDQPYYIHEDDKEIDITDDVRQELVVHLPMKRIAPAYRDKNFEEIHPSASSTDTSDSGGMEDERWAKLKNLRFPNSNN